MSAILTQDSIPLTRCLFLLPSDSFPGESWNNRTKQKGEAALFGVSPAPWKQIPEEALATQMFQGRIKKKGGWGGGQMQR